MRHGYLLSFFGFIVAIRRNSSRHRLPDIHPKQTRDHYEQIDPSRPVKDTYRLCSGAAVQKETAPGGPEPNASFPGRGIQVAFGSMMPDGDALASRDSCQRFGNNSSR